MEHNNNLFLALLTLIFAGIGHAIQELHAIGVFHYVFITAEGLMYLASFAVGMVTVLKYLKKK